MDAQDGRRDNHNKGRKAEGERVSASREKTSFDVRKQPGSKSHSCALLGLPSGAAKTQGQDVSNFVVSYRTVFGKRPTSQQQGMLLRR